MEGSEGLRKRGSRSVYLAPVASARQSSGSCPERPSFCFSLLPAVSRTLLICQVELSLPSRFEAPRFHISKHLQRPKVSASSQTLFPPRAPDDPRRANPSPSRDNAQRYLDLSSLTLTLPPNDRFLSHRDSEFDADFAWTSTPRPEVADLSRRQKGVSDRE